MRQSIFFVVALILVLSAGPAVADLVVPGQERRGPAKRPVRPAAQTPLRVEVDPQATQCELILPRKFLNIDDRGSEAAPQSPEQGRWGTLLGGLALSCTMMIAGVWIARRRGNAKLPVLLVVAAGLSGAAASVLWADVIPFSGPRPRPPVVSPQPGVAVIGADRVAIRVVDSGEEVRLVVPPSFRDKLTQQPGRPRG